MAPASELIRDRHGTCLGYSILLASLARADGIPTRLRMGFIYLEGMWGGHAWVEVYAGGRWRPLDATVYYPGVADPARVAATIETGAGGMLTGTGELAKLYGKVDVRTLAFVAGGERTEVRPDAADHQVSGDVYRNPWLGLTVTRPQGMAFADLDAHWPSSAVMSMKGDAGQVSIHQAGATPDRPLGEQVKAILDGALGGRRCGAPEPVLWNGAPAVKVRSPRGAVIAARKDDQLWMVIAIGDDASSLLDQALPGVSIDDVKG